MEIHRALNQISEIHDQLAKAEFYRGYRSIPVAFSGIVALLAAALQNRVIGSEGRTGFVIYWSVVGVLGAIVAGGGIVYNYFFRESESARRLTRRTVGQMLPALAAAVVLTGVAVGSEEFDVSLLPGIWACLYSLGIFASRPYLPRIIGWVALFYFVAGILLLSLAGQGRSPSPWGMGLTFGLGQLFGGAVLHWNLERKDIG